MPIFVYTARDRAGNRTTGTLEAESDARAVAQLQEQGLWITELRPAPPGAGGAASFSAALPTPDRSLLRRLRSPVSQKDLALFYRQLATMLHSGMALYQSLELFDSPHHTPNAALRRVVRVLGQQVLRGGPLSMAMARYPWLFDRMQVRMIEAAETSGLLVETCRRLADYLEREYEIRLDIARKTLYPKLVLVLLLFVWPIQVPLTLAGYLSGLFGLVWTILLVAAPAWLLLRLVLTSSAGRALYDQAKLAIPVVGKVVRKLAAARFARTLAALYAAGVPIGSAVEVAGESAGNYLLEQHAHRVGMAVARGAPVADGLAATGFFPPMFLGMVRTGEASGNLDTMLDKAAGFYEEESLHATTQLVIGLGVAALIVAAILVLLKLLSFYVGMVQGLIGAAGGAGGE